MSRFVQKTMNGIRPSYRGKGLGRKILQEGIQQIREYYLETDSNLRRVYLFMESNNIPAIALYERTDFKKIVSIPDFYPTTDCTMWLKRIE